MKFIAMIKQSILVKAVTLSAALLFVVLMLPGVAFAEASMGQAEQLFEQTCAGCHLNGGNIIRRGKSLKLKALKRYGMDSHEAIANIITNGKGTMSAYGEKAEFGAPTRLKASEIDALADYVLVRAASDWK